MTSVGKGGENPQMDDTFAEQADARLSWFLAGAYAGGAKRKRIARDFNVSPETAKGWLNGQRPNGRHFDAMVQRWGRQFLAFVYPVSAEQHYAELEEIAVRLARLEGRVDAQMVDGNSAGLAPAQGDANDQDRCSARQGTIALHGSIDTSQTQGGTVASGISAPRREITPGATSFTSDGEGAGRPVASCLSPQTSAGDTGCRPVFSGERE